MDIKLLPFLDNWMFDKVCAEYKRHPAPDYCAQPMIASFVDGEPRPKILRVGHFMKTARTKRELAGFVAYMTTVENVQLVALACEAWIVMRPARELVPKGFQPSKQVDRFEAISVAYHWNEQCGAMVIHKIIRSTGPAVLERGKLIIHERDGGGILGGNLHLHDETSTRH